MLWYCCSIHYLTYSARKKSHCMVLHGNVLIAQNCLVGRANLWLTPYPVSFRSSFYSPAHSLESNVFLIFFLFNLYLTRKKGHIEIKNLFFKGVLAKTEQQHKQRTCQSKQTQDIQIILQQIMSRKMLKVQKYNTNQEINNIS